MYPLCEIPWVMRSSSQLSNHCGPHWLWVCENFCRLLVLTWFFVQGPKQPFSKGTLLSFHGRCFLVRDPYLQTYLTPHRDLNTVAPRMYPDFLRALILSRYEPSAYLMTKWATGRLPHTSARGKVACFSVDQYWSLIRYWTTSSFVHLW